MDKALDDVIVAYGQNGEALRPEQGYPTRLVVPGWEGHVCIKWLHRLHLVDQPSMTREEAAGYTDLMPDGKARMFTFVMEAKSVITRPSGEQTLSGPGFYEISGLAWSGRGRIERVEVSTDGGQVWASRRVTGAVPCKGCASCHGEHGEGHRGNPPIAGGLGTLKSDAPLITIGSYWPYATTVWDYINRAMPYQEPGSLTPGEVYSATAYVLYLNGIVSESEILNAKSLPKVKMPNRNGFVPDPRPDRRTSTR